MALDHPRNRRCYVIAEAGSNHNGDLTLATRLIDAAAETGADAIKFQLFRADRLYPRGAGAADYLRDQRDIVEIVAGLELPTEWLPKLADRSKRMGVDFLVTPFDERSADAIDPFVKSFKVASYELTHHPLLRHVAAKAKPLIMSTGASNLDEIAEALAVARGAGAPSITLLQCTAAYPAKIASLNISAIPHLRERFGVDVGLSDHSADPVIAPVAAVALGATVIEKHVTLDRTLPGPDHRFAVEPDQLRQLVAAVRATELALGTGVKDVQSNEEELRSFARRSIFAVRDIEKGETLDLAAIRILRSGKLGHGLHPRELDRLLGRRAARPIAAHALISPDDVA
jgi:sialic acid synthase SpsE